MSDNEIRRILIEITLDIAKQYENTEELFQKILNKIRRNELFFINPVTKEK